MIYFLSFSANIPFISLYIKKTSEYIAFLISELAKREHFTIEMSELSKKCSMNIDFI